jgi:hypothetical protein
MADYSRVAPDGWDQGDDTSTVSRVSPDGWEQFAGAGAGVTGTSATTNAADTSSASGTTTVTGTSATTNAADTSSASGATTVTGTSATTNADDAAAASGTVGGAVSGTVATTNADDAGAASGTTTVVCTSAASNADDASTASGTTTIVGTSATTNADDAADASGVAGAVTGTVAVTNADDIAAAFEAVQVIERARRGGGSNFVKARKRLAVEYLIEYLTEEEPSAETKRVIAEIKAGRPVPADAKPPSVARSLSVADLADKIIPRRLMSYQNLIVGAIEPQRVIARAVRIAQERDDEDVLMLL